MSTITIQAYYPEKKSVGELLALTNPAIIVPDWQRNYSWTQEHVETFWNDIVKFSERAGNPPTNEYFFGSIVLVRTSDQRLLLLDGQQRLATSTILISAVRDALQSLHPDTASWVQSNYLSSFDPIKGEVIHKLRLNVYDRDFFQQLVSQPRDAGYVPPEPQHASHNLIDRAKAYLLGELNTNTSLLPPSDAIRWLQRIVNILANHFTVIAAFSENEDSAAEVFETLNDRGIGLSTPDLLRNLIIRNAAAGERDEIVERWEDVISFQTDAEIKAFLRHYWISKHGDVKSQSLYREVKSTIEAQQIPSLQLSTELRDAARLYRRLRGAEDDDDQLASLLRSIITLGAGASILFPALLSIFQTLADGERRVATTALLNIYVREAIIGSVENSVLENRFHRAARDLRSHANLAAFCSSIAENALPDGDVRTRFARLSLTANGPRRYILYCLEMAKRTTSELDVANPRRVHVEHIYPQSPADGQRWANHAQWVNRLGNLTLLDYRINTSIKNSVFSLKKEHYAKSEILITRELLPIDDWTPERVSVRQEEMSGLVTSIWPILAG